MQAMLMVLLVEKIMLPIMKEKREAKVAFLGVVLSPMRAKMTMENSSPRGNIALAKAMN